MDFDRLFERAVPLKHHHYFGKIGVKARNAFLVERKVAEDLGFKIPLAFAYAQESLIALPLKDYCGKITAAQFISDKGERINFPQELNGAFMSFGRFRGRVLIGGEYESMVLIHEATREMCVCTATGQNLFEVGNDFRERYSTGELVICSDTNGLEKAREVAAAISAEVVAPVFVEGESGSSFCDLALRRRDGFIKDVFKALVKEVEVKPTIFCIDDVWKAAEKEAAKYMVEPCIRLGGGTLLTSTSMEGGTFLAMSIAHAVACGRKLLNWNVSAQRSVLYLTGGSQVDVLARNLKNICAGTDMTPGRWAFRILTLAKQVEGFDITMLSTQSQVEKLIESSGLLVLDNVPTLVKPKGWGRVRSWLASLKVRGMSVLLLGNSNELSRDPIVDNIITLAKGPGLGPGCAVVTHEGADVHGESRVKFVVKAIRGEGGGIVLTVVP